MGKEFNALKEKNKCVEQIRSIFSEKSEDCKAVVGIFNDEVSSVVAALCVEALGSDNVIPVIMLDDKDSNSFAWAYFLCGFLKITPVYKFWA